MLTWLLFGGEIRVDWRSRWVAVLFPPNSDAFDGVDILCNRQKEISEETVKAHMKGILSKLGAKDRTHAVMIAVNRGIIQG